MATATLAAVSHQLPPMHLPQVPRVRPPRILPGTPSPNSNPQPDGPVPDGAVWVQGKWRNQASNAAKEQQRIISQRVKRALKHENHGMNIYAYKHIRSSQVVYSLTRIMESSQIMPQLVYHGKKTVPAALRRDVWRPYFSVHFPETPAGARAGLTAYHRLRQFAMRRQLDPPPEHLIATEKDYNKALTDGGDPVDVREKRIGRKIKLPMIGQRLPKRMRAKKLMDQKATSVADLAFVLKLARRSMVRLQKESKVSQEEEDQERFKLLGKKGIKRLKAIREEEKEEEKEIAERQSMVETVDAKQGKMPLDKKVAEQLSIEYDGAVGESNRVINMADIESARGSSQRDPKEIQVLWADIRDGTYAQEWHEGVFHQELQQVVTSKRAEMRIRQHEAIDEEGYMIDQQRGPVSVVSGSSPHIFGREKSPNHKSFQEELKEREDKRRDSRAPEVARLEDYWDRQSAVQLRARYTQDVDSFDALVSDPSFIALAEKEEHGEYLNPAERSRLASQTQLLDTLRPLRRLESKYPDLAADADLREYWEMCSEPQSGRLKSVLNARRRSKVATREAEQASKIQRLQNKLKGLLSQKVELQIADSLNETESHTLERGFKMITGLLEGRRQPARNISEQKPDTAQISRANSEVAKLLDQALHAASEADTATGREEIMIKEEKNHDLSRSTYEARTDATLTSPDQQIPHPYSAPVLDIIRGLQSLAADIQRNRESLDDMEDIIFTAEMFTLDLDEAYVKERNTLQMSLSARERTIEQVKQQIERQRGSTTIPPPSEETIASMAALEIPVGDATAHTVPLLTLNQLRDKLTSLHAAQSADQARMEELKDAEVAKFAKSSHHIDVAELLPKSYRDPKYWADEPEDEAVRIAREERELNASREEQERREALKREEEKGFLRRLSQRVGGVFRRKTSEF